MSHHLEMAQRLRKEGHRLTPQRLAVLEVIKANAGHMTLSEILNCLKPRYPSMTIPTIYRNLQWLVELKLVAQTDLGGGCHVYEYIAEKHHHHLVCFNCLGFIDLPDSFLDGLRQALREQYGFLPCMEHLALFGICPDCQKQRPELTANSNDSSHCAT